MLLSADMNISLLFYLINKYRYKWLDQHKLI